jgi:hypothetical protein
MHRFSRMHLSAADALRKLDTIDLEEKSRIAEGIALIAVIDHRKDYLGAGYASMFSYCTGRLHMSEDKAVRRIEVARLALRVPEVLDCLADGRLSVTTACVLVPHLTMETAVELLAVAAYRSRQEIVQILAERSRPVVSETLTLDGPDQVEDSSNLSAPVRMNSRGDECASQESEPKAASHTPGHANGSRRGQVRRSATGGFEVRLAITDEELNDLRQAQALLGHAVPSGDLAEVYARAMKHYLAHLEKKRLGVKPASAAAAPHVRGRGIPKPLRRFVSERDGGRYAFVSADGHRCESTRQLEIDHIQPIALGGETKPENLRLLCRPHNQYEAERVLGKDHVAKKRELAQRERARDKAAAKSSGARGQARKAASENATKRESPPPHPHHDDILAALSGLGFHKAEASRGADLARSQPEASLEACVRLALTVLTRAVAVRGERRAKSSA